MAQPALVTDDASGLQVSPTNKQSWISWISSWSDSFRPKQSNQDESQNETHEETQIINWFNDIIDGTESDKTKSNILSQTYQRFSENNIFGLVTNSKLRKAATTLGKLSHSIHLCYPPKQQLTPLNMSQHHNTQLLTEIQYCVRHALASYKKLKLAVRTKESIIALKSTKTLLRDYFHISAEDIIIDNSHRNIQQFREKLHAPRFYVVVDHKNKKIVLSIRGTATMTDGLTDINGAAKPFCAFNINGFAHEGILASAKCIFDNVTIELVKQCKKYTDYQVIICGHSLGAGVSSLLGLMYYQHPIIWKQNRLKVFAFASPPVLSREFTDTNIGMDYILSIALSTDFVTRLSIQSVKQHNLRTDIVSKCREELIQQCITAVDDDGDDDPLNNERHTFLNELKAVHAPNTNEQLFPLGRVLWFVPNAMMEDDEKQHNDVEEKIEIENRETNLSDGLLKDDTRNRRSNWNETWQQFCNKMPQIESVRSKKLRAYGSEQYVLCDATKCRNIFQEFIVDFPESFLSHLPQRYLWACGTTITDA